MLHDFCCLSPPPALQNFPDMICFILKFFFFLASYQFQGQLSETVTPRKQKNQKTKSRGEEMENLSVSLLVSRAWIFHNQSSRL